MNDLIYEVFQEVGYYYGIPVEKIDVVNRTVPDDNTALEGVPVKVKEGFKMVVTAVNVHNHVPYPDSKV